MENPISVLIVDDEPLGRELVKRRVAQDERFQIIAECESGEEAVEVCRSPVDVVFLDIEMPGMDGLEFLEHASLKNTIIVIVSAFSDYAVDAFKWEVFDYIIKPIDSERFAHTLNRVFRRHQEQWFYKDAQADESSKIAIAKDRGGTKKSLNTFGGRVLVSVEEIHFLESSRNYVKVRTEKESYLVRETLVRLINYLGADELVRVHRSYAVNLKHVKKVSVNSASRTELTLDCGEVIPVSKSRRKSVVSAIDRLLDH